MTFANARESRGREDVEAFAVAVAGIRLTADLYEIELVQRLRLIIGWCKDAKEYLSAELPSGI